MEPGTLPVENVTFFFLFKTIENYENVQDKNHLALCFSASCNKKTEIWRQKLKWHHVIHLKSHISKQSYLIFSNFFY